MLCYVMYVCMCMYMYMYMCIYIYCFLFKLIYVWPHFWGSWNQVCQSTWKPFVHRSKSQCFVSNAFKCWIWLRPQSMWFINVYHFPCFSRKLPTILHSSFPLQSCSSSHLSLFVSCPSRSSTLLFLDALILQMLLYLFFLRIYNLISSLVNTCSIASPPIILWTTSLPNCLPTCLNALVIAILPTPATTPIIYFYINVW